MLKQLLFQRSIKFTHFITNYSKKFTRLSRSLSTPRKCTTCIRMVYFKAIRCKQCCNIMHQTCASSHRCQRIRRSSFQPLSSDDYNELITSSEKLTDWKIMSLPNTSCSEREETRIPKSPINGILKVANWLSHRRKSKELINRANAADKHVKGRFGLFDNKSHRKIKHLFKNGSKNNKKTTAHLTLEEYQRKYSSDKCSSKCLSFSPVYLETINRSNANKNNNLQILLNDSDQFAKHCVLAKARTLSIETKKIINERLCATWPQSTTTVSSIDDFILQPGEYEKYCNEIRWRNLKNLNINEVIKEWSIPYKDLCIKETIRKGQNGYIMKGHWHGDVLIYTFNNRSEDDDSLTRFYDKIVQLSMVRHENIVLFMGACVEMPNLAVITSMRKGPSLYEHIHLKQQTLSLSNKINIARQIAQAMGYLHAKGITHKRLNSDNVILESKVKICLMDQGSVSYGYNGKNYGLISRGHLTYLSPRIIQSILVEPPYICNGCKFTQESDIYSFGTILFELMVGRYPFSQFSSHTIIWLIGNGHHDSVLHIKGSPMIRWIVESCWAPSSANRPPFSHIVQKLQHNIPLNKKHSSSEPERLNKIGLL